MTHEIIILYVPCPNKKSARRIGQELLKNNVAACIQTFKTESMYCWNNKTEEASEFILLVKTLRKSATPAISIIKKLHKYELPCILQITGKVNKEYYEWMTEVMN